MTRDPIFQKLPAELLPQLAKTLTYDPMAGGTSLSTLSQPEQVRWLDAHRSELEDHISFVGSSFLSYMVGNGKSYRQLAMDMADKLGGTYRPQDSTAEIEKSIIGKVWNDTVARMTPEQQKELLAQTEALAANYGVSLGKEMTGFATLTAAQISGFGVYLLGSTLLGAINGALGLGLGFGAFTGLSSLISTVIGPAGWAALGLFTLLKLGRPNYKKLLPAIILIATARAAQDPGSPSKVNGPVNPPNGTKLATVPSRPSDSITRTSKLPAAQIQNRVPPKFLAVDMLPANPVIRELQWEVSKVTERSRNKAKHSPTIRSTPQHKYSKRERTVFDLKHKALAAFTRNLWPEYHYLDLPSEDRALVDELFRQCQASEQEDTQERERIERLRAENQKREHRLINKGKIRQLDEERKRNFDKEFPDLARTAAEYDDTRHYLELSANDQQFIKEYVAEELKASARDALQSQRLSKLEQTFEKSLAGRQGILISASGSKEEIKSTDRAERGSSGRKGGAACNRFHVVNLEAGHPTVEEARKQLSEKIKSANSSNVSVLKLIHGYGSTGNGGAIRNGIRHSLRRRRSDGSVRVVVHGEHWSIFSQESRQVLDACPELKADRDLERSNPGITFVLL